MMIAATSATPSTLSSPAVPALITGAGLGVLRTQPGDTAYHSGSLAPSTSFATPSVRHGSRPSVLLVGKFGLQALPARPSFAVPASLGDSGHGRRPGMFSD